MNWPFDLPWAADQHYCNCTPAVLLSVLVHTETTVLTPPPRQGRAALCGKAVEVTRRNARAETPITPGFVPKLAAMGGFDSLPYASLSKDPRIRGRQFEEICKWFFENDPVYELRAEDRLVVERLARPVGRRRRYRLGGRGPQRRPVGHPGQGIRPEVPGVGVDVDKFLAESGRRVFAYRMLIATTDLIDRTGERTIQQQEKRSSFFRLNDLRAASVDWPTTPAQLRPKKRRKPAKPRPHQQDAIRDVVKGFRTSDRGQLIMACGTGKRPQVCSSPRSWKAQRTLVLLPSLSLLKQTLNEWRANCITDFRIAAGAFRRHGVPPPRTGRSPTPRTSASQ